uniref:Ribosomal protein S11 n=1 Tax=Gloeotilopsis planctonica TaxID=34157 RepID=A0A1B2RYZ3_9CHLO|nr:ribosomal protein S11 [Gloeotilopsis planctonica]
MLCQNTKNNKSFFFSYFDKKRAPFENFSVSTFTGLKAYQNTYFKKQTLKYFYEKVSFFQEKSNTFHKTTGNQLLPIKTLPKNPLLFGLICISSTKNNTHASISNLFGETKTKWSISAGHLKLQGGRRKTRLSQRMVYKSCLEKALSFGYKYAVIHCKGTRGSKVRIFRFFGNSLSVLLIKDTTGAAHNGCRPPKIRRV